MKICSVSSRSSSSSCPPTPTWRERFQSRWNTSWWCERVEVSDLQAVVKLRGGMLGVCRQERVRRAVALMGLSAFLGSQCILPGAFLLSEVHAVEARRTQVVKADEVVQEANIPQWAKMLRAKIKKEKAERANNLEKGRLSQADWSQGGRSPLLLTQADTRGADIGNVNKKRAVQPPLIPVPGSQPGQVLPSASLDKDGGCENCEIEVRALDLSPGQVPGEKQLRQAGQLGGALTPSFPASPIELEERLDGVLERLGVKGGLSAKVSEKEPSANLLKRARKKLERSQAINRDFGEAIQEWNKHNYRAAAGMFEKHLREFPESPWAGEAEMHLGCDAKYNGRFAEAQEHYDAILKNSRSTPNRAAEKEIQVERKQKLAKGSRGNRPADRLGVRSIAQIDAAVAGAATPFDAIDRVGDQTDFSFDLHQKAKARWADLDISTGRWNEAAQKLQDVIATDSDWRRVTWAQNWLITLTNLGPEAKRLALCGPQALERILVQLDKSAAARKVGATVPKTLAGLSLAELETLARDNGVPMHAFKVSDPGREVATLASLPLPAIVHYDSQRGFDVGNSYYAKAKLKRAPLIAVDAQVRKAGKVPRVIAKAMRDERGGPAMDLFGAGAKNGGSLNGGSVRASGHYLVLEKVDARTKQVRLFDPQENRFYHLSYVQMARQWSGKGLALGQGDDARLARLSQAEKEKVRGGCCGTFSPPSGTGNAPDNQTVCPDGSCQGAGSPLMSSGTPSKGEPVYSVNRTNMNVFVKDTPLWYSPGKGPSVELSMAYNSQDGLSQRNAFGNKWMFAYGAYVVEDTQAGGGQVLAFMGDGAVDRYFPNGSGGYTTQNGNINVLRKLTATRYELEFAGGDKALFDRPAGTTSLQSFLVEERDRWGQSLTFGYDANVRLVTITDALGQVTRLDYNSAGRVTRAWDPFGRHASFAYDANNNLIECVDMEGHAFQYSYDGSLFLTRINTAQGPWTFSHSYGYPNRNLVITDPLNQNQTFHAEWWGPSYYSYTDKNGVSNGYSVTATAGAQSRVSQERLADGTTISKAVDTNTGRINSITDARGKTTSFTYNAKGRVTSVTDPKGQTTSVVYAANGLDAISSTNANGVGVGSATYNAFHQLLTSTDEDGTTRYSYTSWGALASVTTPNAKVATFHYDAKGQLVETKQDGVSQGSATYDAMGRVQSVTDMLGLTLGYEYNNLDAITKVTYPDGTTEETDYVCCGLPGVVKDRAGRRSYTDYDAMRRPVRVQDASGNSLQMDYDKEDRLTRLVDAKGQITRWGYDALGRVVSKKYHDGTTESSSYALGLLSQRLFEKSGRGKSDKHESSHGQANEGFAGLNPDLILAGQTPAAREPSEGALHHPTLG